MSRKSEIRPRQRRITRLRPGSRPLKLIDATPGAVFTRPLDINNRGDIVGDYATKPPAS
jgi:hypothetical protein